LCYRLVHRVEERSDIGIEYVAHLLADDPDAERVERIMRAASGSESIREPEEFFLVDRVQQRDHRSLDNLVLQSRDASGTSQTSSNDWRDGHMRGVWDRLE
jgi:hypothetical protein